MSGSLRSTTFVAVADPMPGTVSIRYCTVREEVSHDYPNQIYFTVPTFWYVTGFCKSIFCAPAAAAAELNPFADFGSLETHRCVH